nr:hypothetical protein [Candidatus Sigynarchaeum springense]
MSSKAPGAIPMFDPAGRGSTSLWGISVNQMRVCYYGADSLWHETSFQINEIGYRWVLDGDDSYFASGRDGDYGTAGERSETLLECLQWRKGYVPDRFYPDLRNIFWPDRQGVLPVDGSGTMMNNWPEFHENTTVELWGGATPPTVNSQVRGAIDYDDEIMFLAQNGRKVENTAWYQSTTRWPYRYEVDITDPVDGGHSWVYIYYNTNSTGYATAPTPRNQISNDYYRSLSYIAPGETDQVSWDKNTLSIVATNYRLQVDRYHASQFNDLRITLPGLRASNIFSQFPKDFVQLQGQINFGATEPYATLRTGLSMVWGRLGSWYNNPPPGVTPLAGMSAGSNAIQEYDDFQSGIGVIYHRGNPGQTRSWAYGLQTANAPLDLGWRWAAGANPEGMVPRWWASASGGTVSEYLSIEPPVAVDGSIALRCRWERIDRTQEPFDTVTPGRGYFWMDQNMYVRDAGTYVLLYRPWGPGYPYVNSQNDVLAQSNPNWCDREATVDGPCMAYVERMSSIKGNFPLEWLRFIDADYITLLAEGAQSTDGIVGNFDSYKQNDIVVYPNRLESRGNICPKIEMQPRFLDPAIGMRYHHVFGNFKAMQFDQAISTSTIIYLGPGANVTDATYGTTMNMLENQAWVNARNFPHYYGVPQVGTDGVTPTTRDYHPWDWMNEVPQVPSIWYGGAAKMYSLDGNPSNDASSYTANSPPMAGGTVREYHPWWDYTGSEIAYCEQWLGTSAWRDHIRTRVTASVSTGQGWSTEFEPPVRTPRDPFTGTVTAINYPADWFIVSVPGAGDVWVYQPTREVREIQSNGYSRNIQPPAAVMHYDQAQGIKDSDMKECGLFAARCTLGGSVIPITLAWEFGNFGITSASDALAKGKKEWVRNRFALDSIFTVVRQAPSGVVISRFGPTNGHSEFYKPGDTVELEIISTWPDSQVTFRTAAGGITSTPAVPILTTGPATYGSLWRHTVSFTWTSSPINNVGPGMAPRYDYYWVYADFGSPVVATASCGLLYDIVVPTAATFSLPATTPSPSVIIDWSANKGSDNSDDTYPAPKNAGIARYVLYRGGSPVANVPYGTFQFVDDNGGAGFSDGQVLQYQLRTYDLAGNYASSAVVQTTIALPIANPARFNAQWNRDIDGPTATENPVAAYGNTAIMWGAGAPYSGTITSFEIMRSTSAASGYTTIATGIGPTTYTYTINWASPASVADTYWYKVVSRSASGTVESAPIAIVYDPQPAGQPLAPAIAWSAGPRYAPTERRIPIDITGSGRAIDPGWIADGDPLNTGSGIWRYLVYRMETDNPGSWPGSWTLITGGTVARDTMESSVWYHNDPGLTNNRYYRYLVQAQDFSAPFPSVTWPNGMVNSQYIEFQFGTENLVANQLRVQAVTSSASSVQQGTPFTVTVKVANVGTAATTATALPMIVTQGGIDVSTCFSRTGPVPALGSIASGATQDYLYTYTAKSDDPIVIGLVQFSASVSWPGGSHVFLGNPAVVNITGHHHIPFIVISSILVLSPRAAPGPFIAGESMTVRVIYSNIGCGTGEVDGTLLFGDYPYLTQTNNPAPVTVPIGTSTAYQDFTVWASTSATTQAVTISCSWISNGSPGIGGSLQVNIQAQAAVSISCLAITAPRPAPGGYDGSEVLTFVVTFQNTGGTEAIVDAVIDDGAYTDLTFDNPAAVTVAAGGTQMQTHTITVAAIPTVAAITLTATWTGTEQYSGRILSGDAPADTLSITIPGSTPVAITNLAITGPRVAPGPYVGGETLTLVVTFSNPGTLDMTVDATVDDGAYTGITFSDPAAVIVRAGDTVTQIHTLAVAAGAETAAVTLTVTWTGIEAGTGRTWSGDTPADTLALLIQAQEAVSITTLAITSPRPAPGPYIGSEVLTLQVTFQNVGGTPATVDATIDDGLYTDLSWNDPAAIIVNAGSTNTQYFTIIVAASPATAEVAFTVVWTGTEQYSARALSGDSPADALVINVGAPIGITGLSIASPRAAPGPYVGGETLTLVVTFSNPGTLDMTVDATVDDGAYTGITFSDPAAVIVPTGGTITQTHTLTVVAGAATAAVTLTVTWTGIEAGTGRNLNGDSPVDTLVISIQSRAAISITDLTITSPRAAPGPYMAGETIAMRVTFTNSGGTRATVNTTVDDGGHIWLSWIDAVDISVDAGGTAVEYVTITIAADAVSMAMTITVRWVGTMQYSGDILSGDAPPAILLIDIAAKTNGTIPGQEHPDLKAMISGVSVAMGIVSLACAVVVVGRWKRKGRFLPPEW